MSDDADLDAVKYYDPATNDYDVAKDPRCLWGWGLPSCRCMFGHFCCRPLGHAGECWDGGDKPHRDDPRCARSRRPKDWDTKGRAAEVIP